MVIRSNEIAGKTQVAASLAVALSDNLVSMAEANWNNIYGLSKGAANKYYVATSTGQFVVQSGTEQAFVSGFPFSRYFYIEMRSATAAERSVPEQMTLQPKSDRGCQL